MEKARHQLAHPTYEYKPKNKQAEKQRVSKEKDQAQAQTSLSTVQPAFGDLLPTQSLSPICASPDFSFAVAFSNDANSQLPAVLDTVVTSDLCADAPLGAESLVNHATSVSVELDHCMLYNHDPLPAFEDTGMGGLVEENHEPDQLNFGIEEISCCMEWNKGLFLIWTRQNRQ